MFFDGSGAWRNGPVGGGRLPPRLGINSEKAFPALADDVILTSERGGVVNPLAILSRGRLQTYKA